MTVTMLERSGQTGDGFYLQHRTSTHPVVVNGVCVSVFKSCVEERKENREEGGLEE